jgi:hypothetical protein
MVSDLRNYITIVISAYFFQMILRGVTFIPVSLLPEQIQEPLVCGGK